MEGSGGIRSGEWGGPGRELVTWVLGQGGAEGGAQVDHRTSKCEIEGSMRACVCLERRMVEVGRMEWMVGGGSLDRVPRWKRPRNACTRRLREGWKDW